MTTLLGFCRGRFSLHKACLPLFSYYLWFTVHVVWSIEAWLLSPLSTNLLYWAFWAWIFPHLGLGTKTHPYNIYTKLKKKKIWGGWGALSPPPTIALPILIGYNKASNYIKICLASILMTKQGRSAKISTNFIKRFGYKGFSNGDIISMLNLFIFRD